MYQSVAHLLRDQKVGKFVKNLDNHEVRGCGDAVKLLLFTGCRKMEILALKGENVNFEEQTLYLPETKNGRSRNILFNLMALAALEKRRTDRDGKIPYVFPAPRPDCKTPTCRRSGRPSMVPARRPVSTRSSSHCTGCDTPAIHRSYPTAAPSTRHNSSVASSTRRLQCGMHISPLP